MAPKVCQFPIIPFLEVEHLKLYKSQIRLDINHFHYINRYRKSVVCFSSLLVLHLFALSVSFLLLCLFYYTYLYPECCYWNPNYHSALLFKQLLLYARNYTQTVFSVNATSLVRAFNFANYNIWQCTETNIIIVDRVNTLRTKQNHRQFAVNITNVFTSTKLFDFLLKYHWRLFPWI